MLEQLMRGQMGGQQQGQQQMQGQQGGPLGNTLSLAGLLLASGQKFQDALPIAAQMSQQQQQQQMQQYQAQQQQQQQMKLQSLGELIANNPEIGTKQLASELLKSGVPPQNVAQLVNSISPLPNYQLVKDTIFGEPNQAFDKTTGRFLGGSKTNNADAGNTTDNMQRQLSADYTGNGPSPATNKGPALPEKQNPFKMPEQKEQRMMEMPKEMPGTPKKENINFFDNFLKESEGSAPNVKFTLKEREANLRDFNKFRSEQIAPKLEAAREIHANSKEIVDAMKHFKTGAGAEYKLAAEKIGSYLGINTKGAAAGEVLQKASNKLVLDYAKQMKGVISDKDIMFLKQMVPGLSITPEGNKQIIEYFNKIADRGEKYAKSAEKYFTKNRTLEGFESSWNDYNNRHELFKDLRGSKEYQELLNKKIEEREAQQRG